MNCKKCDQTAIDLSIRPLKDIPNGPKCDQKEPSPVIMVAYHEMQHRNHVLEGLPFTGDYKTVVYPNEEYRTYITCYKNQGLFPHHMFSDLGDRINSMGSMLNRSDETFLMYSNLVDKPWWWFIYKIPRRW